MTIVTVYPDVAAPPGTTVAAPAGRAGNFVAAARSAQRDWAAVPLRHRLRRLRAMRHRVATDALPLAHSIDSPARTPAERLASEVLPLADAIRFLERSAPALLRPRRLGPRGRPLWLGRVRLEIFREPLGVVLIIAPSNYPLLLAAVQAVQALAAGNAVLLKPAPGHAAPVRRLAALAADAGIDPRLLIVLGDDVSLVHDSIAAGVDKVFLTGSANTGAAVLSTLAPRLTPAVMELSGHDAVYVCDGADLPAAARCVAYGLTLNGGSTCIAPRRVFVPRPLAADFERLLSAAQATSHASAARATEPSPPAISVIPVRDLDHALALGNESPCRLGATVFGPPTSAAAAAARIDAGCVVVNDIIVPTADPRLPFGGRGRSGFGVTRGAEGLLEMTRVKAVATRLGSFRPHLDPPHPLDEDLFRHYLAAAHGGSFAARWRGVVGVVSTLLRRRKP